MGKSSLNDGWCTLPHRECQLRIADGSTWSSTTPRHGQARCAAMRPSSHPLGSRAPQTVHILGALQRRTARARCSGLGGWRALEWRGWPLRAASGRKELRQLSAARPARAGRAVGGAYWLLPCSRPSSGRRRGFPCVAVAAGSRPAPGSVEGQPPCRRKRGAKNIFFSTRLIATARGVPTPSAYVNYQPTKKQFNLHRSKDPTWSGRCKFK